MALIADVAQAVTDELNGGAFSQPFTAERQYLPLFELPEMKQLHVTVVPRGIVISALDRGRCQHDVQIDVAVQKKFGSDAPVEIDPLMSLVQEIADFFKLRRLVSMPTAAWIKTENAPIYALEHMQELRQFTSVLTLTFKVIL
jgi:hypothetical protein